MMGSPVSLAPDKVDASVKSNGFGGRGVFDV